MRLQVPDKELAAFCRRHQIRRLAFFGSVLRDDFSLGSDVDVLVEFEPGTRVGLIGFAGIENEPGRLIGRNVDLNTAGFLSPYFREEILRDAETAYANEGTTSRHPLAGDGRPAQPPDPRL